MIPGISTNNLVTANFVPREDSSNRNMGILVVDQAPMNIRTLLNLTPFFINTAAIGNAPYSGPAAAEPKINAKIIPFNPEPSPMNRIMVSLGTHTSNKPNKIKK